MIKELILLLENSQSGSFSPIVFFYLIIGYEFVPLTKLQYDAQEPEEEI